MRDLIWTLIIVWFVYRIFTMFRVNTSKSAPQQPSGGAGSNPNDYSATRSEEARKNALHKHLNKEGEYVDFEEIK